MPSITAARWWRPSDPSKSLPGVLFEDEEHGWLLQLDGSFEESFLPEAANTGKPIAVSLTLPDEFPILLGTTSQGRLVSLINCQVVQGSPPFVASRGLLTICPATLVYDVHFDSIDDFCLSSLSIRYSHLDAWVATSGFWVHFDPALYPVEVRYSKPNAIEVALSDSVSIGVGFSASGPSIPAATEVRIVQQSWLTITSTQDLLYDQLLAYVTNLANLISLGVGKPLRPLEIVGTCKARNGLGPELSPASIQLVQNGEAIAPVSRDVPHWEMLFTLPEIRERFGELVLAWFSRDETFQSLCDLYFGTARSPSMYVEHRFLNMFQALESYDRRTFKPTPERAQKHQERLDRILNSVDSADRSWLQRHLRHSHEPAAADRIRRLVRNLDATWLLTDEDIRLAADLRNYYTHFDSSIDPRLPISPERFRVMHNLAVRLRVLCELVLLDAVGFSSDDMQERMKKTRRVERHLAL